jgi:CRISPR/Cas system-associated exonuclease Cas4 (RecB family)
MIFKHEPIKLDYEDLLCETKETGRIYATPQGNKYPSITTVLGILSEGYIQAWRSRVGEEEANRISRKACVRGTAVHTLVEKFVNNEEVLQEGVMPDVMQNFKSLMPILESRLNNIRLQEKPLYSDHLGVAGRVDIIGEFDGKLSIVDIKTSKKKKYRSGITNYFMQEAAYAIMFEERTGIPITQLVTLMSVDYEEPLVFIEHRDDWTDSLLNTIEEYRKRKLFGHA